MPAAIVTRGAIAALFLERQHLARPRAVALSPRRLCRFVEDVGGVQMDSINVIERAHYLTVWSRFGPYDRRELDRVVYGRRLLFEYWAHAACLVATSTLPYWRRAMLDYRVRHTGWSDWLRRNPKVLDRVRAAILANGPMANADFESRRPPSVGTGWWNWKPVQHALHYLWMTGVLTVDSRRHFQKRFDVFERAIPGVRDVETVSPDAFARWHARRSLFAMGAATSADLSRYLTFPRFAPRSRQTVLRALTDAGEIAYISVEGSSQRWLVLARDVPVLSRTPPAARGTTLLSPFDSLLWHRDRVVRLFGFDYRIEVYTPAHRRVHGYYTLPILHDGEIIGRIDAKTHRSERRLEARHVHFEPWFAAARPAPVSGATLDRDRAVAGVAEALRSLAAFVGVDGVSIERVTPQRLRAALARRVDSAEPGADHARIS
jgi:uncharacterized protein YcaQ